MIVCGTFWEMKSSREIVKNLENIISWLLRTYYELSRAYYRDTLWLSTILGNRTDFLENLEFVLGNVFVNLHTIHDSAASILRCSRRFHISDP